MIESIEISKSFGERLILDGVSVSVREGETTAIVGPSGCGKTTLLRILCFLDQPESGHIEFSDGKDKFDSRQTLKPWPRLTCVFQKQFLWPHMTVRQNITAPMRERETMSKAKELNRVFEMFDMVEFLDRHPHQISGGEAQRASLARAIILKPRILLLDEAHTFLDMAQQEKLNDYLRQLKNDGIGLCVVSHSLRFVKAEADRIYVLEAGRVTESGGKEIIDSPSSVFLKSVAHLTT
jgi:ABC-type polar amino acid transport system ATPase subunit